jgi:hypothetical protein
MEWNGRKNGTEKGALGSDDSRYVGELVAAVFWLSLQTASTTTEAGTMYEGWVDDEGDRDGKREGAKEVVCVAARDEEGVSISVEGCSIVGGFSSGCTWGAEGGSSNFS